MADITGSVKVDDEPTNIISLSEARNRYRYDKCRHKRILVDEVKAECECRDCGEKLNPMVVLARLAEEESRLKYRIDQMRKLNHALDDKKRTKCEHCGRLTRVRVTMP
jgi:Zn finger protein HypA/HybF involved in hydrogenase expression